MQQIQTVNMLPSNLSSFNQNNILMRLNIKRIFLSFNRFQFKYQQFQILIMKIILILLLALLCASQDVSYSQDISSRAIQLSASIYEITKADKQKNVCRDCYKGFTLYKSVLGNKILALVGYDHELKTVVVVFRGSSNLNNWLTDANIIMVEYDQCKGCKVHAGFYNSYRLLVIKGLDKVIKEAVNARPTYSLLFTGHSLGGAVANLAAVSYKRSNPSSSVLLYTYGQPRVGNDKYAEYLDQKLAINFRVVHQKDIVPHKPAYYAFYRHSGFEVWYQNGMKNNYYQCKGDSNYCSNSLGSFSLNYSIGDHSSKNYIRLWKKTNRSTGYVNTDTQALNKKLIKAEKEAFIDLEIMGETTDLFDGQEDL